MSDMLLFVLSGVACSPPKPPSRNKAGGQYGHDKAQHALVVFHPLFQFCQDGRPTIPLDDELIEDG